MMCFFYDALFFLLISYFLQNNTVHSLSPPFQLQNLDHIVLNCQNFETMFDFYTKILGCTIDSPDDVGRMNGKLTHLRAGKDTMIDLMTTTTGDGGDNDDDHPTTKDDTNTIRSGKSALNHFCLLIDSFDEDLLEEYFHSKGIQITSKGLRKGAQGIGPSIYIQDPEGNSIELKGRVSSKTEEEKVETNDELDTSSSKKNNNNSNNKVPLTPCTRICRYNASFFGGQVCIGCYREAYEIGTWSSMTPAEKYMALLDATDRLEEAASSSLTLDGAISSKELERQADYWQSLC